MTSFIALGASIDEKQKKKLSASQELEQVTAATKRLLTKNPTTAQQMAAIEKNIAEIARLEDQAGITPLYAELMKLRHEACKEQQKNSAIQKLFNQVRAIRKKMTEKSSSERSLIEELTQKVQETDDATEQKRLQARVGELEKEIKRKVGNESREIKKLNTSIRALMKPLIDKARPMIKDIQARYRKIEKNIAELDKQISDLVDDVENSLNEKGQLALEKLRSKSISLQRKIIKENRCPELISKERSALAYFI
jgi:chromosome segregation ATPase